MRDTLENTAQHPDYLSYLLRLWRMKEGAAAWRGSIESPHTGERLGFGSLDELFAFLREQTRVMPGKAEATLSITEQKGERHMSLEEMKAKIRWVNEEVWLKGNLEALNEIYSGDCILHSPPLPDVQGLEALKAHIAGIRSAYTENTIAYAEMVGEGDRFVYRYTWKARHTGQSETLPIPPTGKEVGMEKCVVVHIADGKIVEEFEHADYLGFLQQLGVVPPLG